MLSIHNVCVFQLCVCTCVCVCVPVCVCWPVRAACVCRLSRMLSTRLLTSGCVSGCVCTRRSPSRPPSSSSMLQYRAAAHRGRQNTLHTSHMSMSVCVCVCVCVHHSCCRRAAWPRPPTAGLQECGNTPAGGRTDRKTCRTGSAQTGQEGLRQDRKCSDWTGSVGEGLTCRPPSHILESATSGWQSAGEEIGRAHV